MADLVIPEESRPVFDYHINKANNNPMANAYKNTQNKTLEDIRQEQIAQGIVKPVVEKVQNNTANAPKPQQSYNNPMQGAMENAYSGKTQEEIEQSQNEAKAKHLSTITANDDKTAMALNNAGDTSKAPSLADKYVHDLVFDENTKEQNKTAEAQPKATAKASAPKQEETAEEQPKTPLEILKSYAGNIGEYLKSPTFRSNSAAVLSDFANSLAQNQPQGQMVDGHFVANTGLGSQLNDMPVVTKQRQQQEFENNLKTQQLADAKEARMQDIAYRNQMLEIQRNKARAEQEAKGREEQIKYMQTVDDLGTINSLISQIDELNKNGLLGDYYGGGKGRGFSRWVGSVVGTENADRAKAIQAEFKPLAMSLLKTMGANPTEGERQFLLDLASGVDMPAESLMNGLRKIYRDRAIRYNLQDTAYTPATEEQQRTNRSYVE